MMDEKPSIHECLIGIDGSLAKIAETLELMQIMFSNVLEGDDCDGKGVIGKMDRMYGGSKYIRTMDQGD